MARSLRTLRFCSTQMETFISNNMDFILDNLAELCIALMAFAKVVVNLTPTEKDNMVFGYLDVIITTLVGDRRKKAE